MELYLGSVIEPIRKSIHDKLYFNSKHAPKTFGEAMQKAQDLHIKYLYAMGEDQQDTSMASSDNIPPEITVNKVNTCDNRGWYWDRPQACESSDYSQNSWTGGKWPDRTITPRRWPLSSRMVCKPFWTANIGITHQIHKYHAKWAPGQTRTSLHNNSQV